MVTFMKILASKYTFKALAIKGFFLMSILLSLISMAFDLSELKIIEAILVIIDSVTLLILNKKNIFLCYILGTIAFSNYSICFTNYILPNTSTIFTGLSDSYAGFIGLQILLLFISFLGFFSAYRNNDTFNLNFYNQCVLQNRRFYFYHVLNYIGLFLILIFAYTRPDSMGDRGSPSTIYEYSILLIIVGLYFSKRNKFIQCCYLITSLLFSIQNFMFGGRITGLQLLFVLLIYHYGNKRISLKLIFNLCILYVVMVSIGTLRGNILSGDSDAILQQLNYLLQNGFSLDTAYSSYFTSLQFILTSDLISTSQRVYMGFLQLLSYFVGGTLLPEANIAVFVSNFYTNYMGGVLPFFGFFCFGWLGVLLYAILLSAYLNQFKRLPGLVNNGPHGFLLCVAIYLSTTAFRWYLYSPNNLIRGVFLLSIVYFISEKFLCFEKKI